MFVSTDLVKMKVKISISSSELEQLICFDELHNDEENCEITIERVKPLLFDEPIYDRSYLGQEGDVLYLRFMNVQKKILDKLKELHTGRPE